MKRKYKWLFCWLLVGAGILPVTIAWSNAAKASLADCLDATCRISTADGSRGTGCAFENSREHVFVLTAAHVVGRNRSVQCEFWREGHRSVPLSGEVIARNESADTAVVCLPVSSFGGILPACIPVAPRGYELREGATVTSVG